MRMVKIGDRYHNVDNFLSLETDQTLTGETRVYIRPKSGVDIALGEAEPHVVQQILAQVGDSLDVQGLTHVISQLRRI